MLCNQLLVSLSDFNEFENTREKIGWLFLILTIMAMIVTVIGMFINAIKFAK
jgi:hypothetical protein